jgi:4-hydroxybenzoate polyprenyltransferase
MIRAWLELARISNLPTVWTNVTAGWLLAGGGLANPLLLWMLAAGSLLYTGGMILNDAADLRFDREHRKERAIPSGRVSAQAAWSVGLWMLAAGWYLAVFLGTASWQITTALVGCILLYDLYHKPWAGAVWVMGMCRVLLMMMPSSTGLLSATCKVPGWALVLPFALGLGAYIVGLTMVARLEAKGATASKAKLWFARLLLFCPGLFSLLMLVWFSVGGMKLVFILADFTALIPLVILGVFILWTLFAMRVMRQGGPAIGRAVGLLLAGIPIVDALAVCHVSLPLAFGFVALAPALRYWQRWVAAT